MVWICMYTTAGIMSFHLSLQFHALIYAYTIAAIKLENMLGYLSLDIICSQKRTVFRERSSRKTVSFKEQIMSKDKYPSIFLHQMEAIFCLLSSKCFWQHVQF